MTIEYVGGQAGNGLSSAFPVTVTFALTGGTDAAPLAGDLVVVTLCLTYADASIEGVIQNGSAVDYTLAATNYGDDTYDCTIRVAYRFMPGTTETTCVLDDASATDRYAYTIHVYRGVDTSSPMDATAVSANGLNTLLADPPAITPVTAGAWIQASGAAARSGGTEQNFSSAELTAFLASTYTSGNRSIVGSGYYTGWSSGAFDPAAFAYGGADSIASSWAAVTLALRPAGAGGSGLFPCLIALMGR